MTFPSRYVNAACLIILTLFICASVQACEKQSKLGKGAKKTMDTYYIGRFSMAIPTTMDLKIRSSKLRYVEIKEIVWPKGTNPEQARVAEWDEFLTKVKGLSPPEGKAKVVLKSEEFSSVGRWTKGIFYYKDQFDDQAAEWSAFMDANPIGVWFIGDLSIVDKELANEKMDRNITNIAKSYQPINFDNFNQIQPDNRFYSQHGAINLPYAAQEESIARFEGHPLNLSLLIEMYMDFTKERETTSLINGTRAMLAAALLTPGNSISKVRLRNREVAGMPGEESVLKVTEGDEKDLVFTWQYNGKDDSGEYPTTRIEMQSHDHSHLKEKLEIWDAILDSMKPMFVRKN